MVTIRTFWLRLIGAGAAVCAVGCVLGLVAAWQDWAIGTLCITVIAIGLGMLLAGGAALVEAMINSYNNTDPHNNRLDTRQ